uniref:Uncharacterized protein n=1 Tax=Oryza rufipogon TaxID=4529 RepID=A0A0E0R2R0_ORYRU
MMRKQSRSPCSSSSSAAVVSLCKVLLMVLALICTLETVSVEGDSLKSIWEDDALQRVLIRDVTYYQRYPDTAADPRISI